MMKILGLLIVAQVIFSIWPIVVKYLVFDGIHPLFLAIIRDIFASCVLWLFVWIFRGCPILFPSNSVRNNGIINHIIEIFHSYSNQEIVTYTCLGINSTINSLGYVVALQYVTPYNSSLLHPSIPVFAAIIGSILRVEKFTAQKALGCGLCIFGSVLVVISQSSMEISGSIFGNGLLVLQSMAMALLLVGQKFLSSRHNALETTAIYYTIGTLLASPICLVILYVKNQLISLSISAIAMIFFGAVFVVALNYSILSYTAKESSPAVTAASMMLQPPLTYLFGFYFQGDQIHEYSTVFGGMIIILGLIVTILPTGRLYHPLSLVSSLLVGGEGEERERESSDESGIMLLDKSINNIMKQSSQSLSPI